MMYHETSARLEQFYGKIVTDDCVRKIIKRKHGQKSKDEGLTRCLVLSDLHIPYCRDDIVDIVKKHAKKIQYLVLGGDVVDCESVSVYKELGKVELSDEMVAAHELLKEIEKITPGVKRYMIFGNHEVRFEKYLATMGGSLTPMHSGNILQEIVGGFSIFDHNGETETSYEPLDYNVVDDWKVQVNDLIVCHPTSFSKIQGRTASNSCEFFVRNGYDFSALYVAHTHKQAFVPNLGKYCYEIGCLCQSMGYASSGKLDYTPNDNGYALAVFNKNKFDANASKVYILD